MFIISHLIGACISIVLSQYIVFNLCFLVFFKNAIYWQYCLTNSGAMFKIEFKYYKSKQPLPELKHVLNFNKPNEILPAQIKIITTNIQSDCFVGLVPPDKWNIYEIVNNPGLIFIQNPFTSLGQRYWTVRSLQYYSKKPNKTNLDVHNLIKENEEWWDVCQLTKDNVLLNKLRWATLGYHHNWDTKEYSENLKSDFPQDLNLLCKYVGHIIGYSNFNAEAAIVNYYHMDSTLSGHTDHSEQTLEEPLFSFSFGQTAIFLLGGKEIDIKPTAMYIHSGDIVIMSKESRLSYHGVPKILHSLEERWEDELQESSYVREGLDQRALGTCSNETLWKPFKQYLQNSRININVRQVLQAGQKLLCKNNQLCNCKNSCSCELIYEKDC